MTVVVGILCSDGVVIAADKQASHGSMAGITVAQRVDKIHTIEDSILFSSSGGNGLSQQIRNVIETDGGGVSSRTYHGYVNKVQPKVKSVVNQAWETAQVAAKTIGPAALSELCGFLMAANFKDGVKLIEVSQQGNFEHYTEQIPFVSIGSGKQNADPFLRYVKHVFFENELPTLNEGIAFAYWTAQSCIDAGSFGVGMGVDVYVIDASTSKARKVEASELTEARSFINELEERWREVRDRMARTSGEPTPQLPKFEEKKG